MAAVGFAPFVPCESPIGRFDLTKRTAFCNFER